MWMRMDLGFALALMNNTWPDLELLPEEGRPIHRNEVTYSIQVPVRPVLVENDSRSLTVPAPSSTDQQ